MIAMSLTRWFRCLFAFLVLLTAPMFGQIGTAVGDGGPGPVKAQHLTVEMISAGPEIAAGGTQTVAFVFTMEEGWHVYWKNAGFAGFPPKVKWTTPPGVTAGPLQFTAPDRLPLNTVVDYGYEDAVAYPLTVQADKKVKGTVHLGAELSWLVCKETCIPGKANLGLDLKAVKAGTNVSHDGENHGELGAAFKGMPKPLPENFQVTARSSGDAIVLTAITGTRETDGEFFPAEQDVIADTAKVQTDTLDNGTQIHFTKSPNAKTMPTHLAGVLKLATAEAYIIDVPIVAGAAPVQAAGTASSTGSITAVSAIALAFLGGVILNLMPCVFPVLFLKALSLLETSQQERKQVRSHGVAYALGILASFWLVVAALLALRAGGRQLGWGFQLQSPAFVVVLASFLFLFALSLSGMFDFGLSLTSKGDSLTKKSGYTGSFFTGVLATVVATPCVGPFMGAAIGFALAQPAWVTFLVFTSLALGLAAPYVLLTLQPAWVKLLPRPGAWMDLLKQITALPLLLTVIWLVYIFGRLQPAEGTLHMAMLLGGLLLIAIAAWVLGRWPVRRWSTLVAVLLCAAAIALPLYGSGADTSGNKDAVQWKTFSAEDVASARSQGKAVFVDFTAAWCLSCQVNERVVLKTSDVEKELRAPNVVPMKADWTQYDPKITAALQAAGRSGVPTYIVYPANPSAAADVLPEVLSKSVVLEALKRDLKR